MAQKFAAKTIMRIIVACLTLTLTSWRYEETYRTPQNATDWPKGIEDLIKNFIDPALHDVATIYEYYVKGDICDSTYACKAMTFYEFKCAREYIYKLSPSGEKVDSLEIADIVDEHTLVDFEIKKDKIVVYRTTKYPHNLHQTFIDDLEDITDGKTPVECTATSYSLTDPFRIIAAEQVMRVIPIIIDFDITIYTKEESDLLMRLEMEEKQHQEEKLKQ